MTNATMIKPKYVLVESVEQLQTLFQPIVTSGAMFAFDIETGYPGEPHAGYSLHPETAFIVGFSFCSGPDAAYYVPLAHDLYPVLSQGEAPEEGQSYNLDNQQVAILFWQLLQTGMGVPHNAKFELRHIASFFRKWLSDHPIFGAQVRDSQGYYPVAGDTFLMAYCIAAYQQFGLKFLTKEMYGHQQVELMELFTAIDPKTGKEKKIAKNKQNQIRFNTLEMSQPVIDYACEDSLWTWHLFHDLPKLLLASNDDVYVRRANFEKIYSLEMRTLRSVCAMEDFGIGVDWGMLAKAAYEGSKFRDRLNQEIQDELSEILNEPVDINLTSPKQMSDLLFVKLGLRTNRYTKSTKNTSNPQMSTDTQVLKTLSEKLPVLKKVIQWREMKTLLTRYLVNYERDYSYAEDGNIHPDLFSAGTITGRFSAAHPNYQQLPKRYYFKLVEAKAVDAAHEQAHGGRFEEDDFRGIEEKCTCGEFPYENGTVFDFNFRLAIIAPTGWKIFGFDYSQAELRAIAGEANETAMLEAFRNGVDIHVKTASLMLRKPIEQITKDDRGIGKTMNFAICYGMSDKSLAERLGCSLEEAKEKFAAYYAGFPNLKKWQDAQVKKVRQGFVYSRFGRRIPLWDLLSKERWIRSKADRVAVNGPIQGGATGDNVKRVMADIHETLWNSEYRDTVKMVMNIHDALEFYVRDDIDINDVWKLLTPVVLKEIEGWAPLVADWHVGTRWGSVTELVEKDGRLVPKKGKKEVEEKIDIVPSVDHEHPVPPPPELEEEPVIVLPSESRTVVVRLMEMPTKQRYANFIDLLKSKEGANRIKLVVPEGSVEVPWVSGLTPVDQKEVSVLFNGARVYFASDTVDKKSFLEGVGI